MTDINNPHSINVYSLKDSATGSFGVIIEARSDVEAIRMIGHSISVNPDSTLSLYPQHYDLYRLGTVNKLSGEFVNSCDLVASCSTIINSSEYSIADRISALKSRASERPQESGEQASTPMLDAMKS